MTNSKLIAIRTKSAVKAPEVQLRALKCIKAEKLYSYALLDVTPTTMGMLTRLRNLLVWFPIDLETIKKLPRKLKPARKFNRSKHKFLGAISPELGIKLLAAMS